MLAADIHRARICLLCTASLLLDAGLRTEKPFPLSPFTFVLDDEGKYSERWWKRRIILKSAHFDIHRLCASACCSWICAVHKSGE